VSGAYNAGSIEASLKLDRSDFNRELTQAKRDAEDFQKQKYSPKVSLDDTEAKTKIASLKQELQSLHNISVTAALSGFDSVTAQLQALRAEADALNAMRIHISVDVDTAAATASLAALRLAAQDDITIHADVDTRTAAASLAALRRAAADPLNIPSNTNGTPDPNRPGTPGDGERNKKKKDGGFSFSSLMSLPAIIALLSPQIPALTNVLLGATAAAASFGVATAGALGAYGAATMGAVKQATAHEQAVKQTDTALKAAQQTLSHTTAGTQSYKDALKAVTAAEQAHKKALDALTPAEKEFTTSLDGVKGAWTGFITSTEKYTLKPVSTVLQGIKTALPQLVPIVRTLAPEFQSVATSLKGWLTGSGLQRFVGFLQETGYPIIHNMIVGFRGFLAAGGDLIRAFGPIAVKMSYYFTVLGAKVDAWAKGGGVERFRDRFIQSWHQVRPIFMGLIHLVTSVWDILNGTGKTHATVLVDVIDAVNTAIGNIKPAAIKALNEIFQSLSDVAERLAPLIGITSKAIVILIDALPPGTIRLIADAFIAWKLAVLGWNAAVAVWGFLTTLVEGLTGAWWLLSLAFEASPLGWILTGIAAIIVIIVLIATKTTWFQTIWHYTWNAIKTAALWAWGYVGPVIMWIANAWWTMAKTVFTVYYTVIKVVWEAVVTAAMWLYHTLKPIFVFIGEAWWSVAKLTWLIWSTVFKVVFILFLAAVKALWIYGLKPTFDGIVWGWNKVGEGVMWVWHHGIKPAWDGVAEGAKWLWNKGIKPALNGIKGGWNDVSDGITSVWNHKIKPAWDAVTEGARYLWNKGVKPPLDDLKAGFALVWDFLKKWVFSPMQTFFTKIIPGWASTLKSHLISAFDAAWKGIQKVWDNVKKAIGSPIYVVAKYVWNNSIVGIMDKISSFVHQKNPLGKIPLADIPHFAAGGPVRGGVKGRDSVLSMLMPGEHVLTTNDVAAMGGQQNVARFRSALHGGAAVQGANSSGAFGLGGWIDSAGSALSSAVSKGMDALGSAVLGAVGVVANPLLNAAKGTIDKLIPRNGGWNTLTNGAMKTPIDWIKGFIGKQDKKAQSVGGVIPAGQHLAIIDAALKAAGAPPPGSREQWEAGLNTLISRESGWNASAINNTDSNAKAGHPSQGLAQTIPSTFQAYVPSALRKLGILNPIANVAAAIRYIIAVYGGIGNVQQANANKAPKGYYTGTSGAAPGLAWVGERGPELVRFHGGETVYNHQDSMRMAVSGLGGYASGTKHRVPWATQLHNTRWAYDERDRDTDWRDAAQRKYAAAHAKYLSATTVKEQQAAKKEMEKYQHTIDSANKQIASDNKLIKLNEKRYKAANEHVLQERRDAGVLAAARKKLMDSQLSTARNFIASAKAAVDAKIATATDARNGYYDAAVQSGQLSGLTGNRAAGFVQQLKDKIKGIKDFQTNLHTLAKMGVSPGIIQQIAAMGPDQGGALAQSLARTTTALDVKNLNSQYSELEKVSNAYADSAANDGFGLSSLNAQSKALGGAKITVTAPNTIAVSIDGKTFKAHTEKVVEEKVTEIVAAAGKKK
jgi:SLT domain-containing protein